MVTWACLTWTCQHAPSRADSICCHAQRSRILVTFDQREGHAFARSSGPRGLHDMQAMRTWCMPSAPQQQPAPPFGSLPSGPPGRSHQGPGARPPPGPLYSRPGCCRPQLWKGGRVRSARARSEGWMGGREWAESAAPRSRCTLALLAPTTAPLYARCRPPFEGQGHPCAQGGCSW